MKKNNFWVSLVTIGLTLFFAGVSFSLLYLGNIKFSNKNGEIQIALTAVLCIYHSILVLAIWSLLGNSNNEKIVHDDDIYDKTKNQLTDIENKLTILNGSKTLSQLSEIEFKHGCIKEGIRSEIWIISNTLQEASKNGNENVKNVIFKNIFENNIKYYYIVPPPNGIYNEVDSLEGILKTKLNGRSSNKNFKYKYINILNKSIPAQYIDIVLYLDINTANGSLNTDSSEGYYCFSEINPHKDQQDKYYYQEIDKKILGEVKEYYSNQKDCLSGENKFSTKSFVVKKG